MLAPIMKDEDDKVLRVQGNDKVCQMLNFWHQEAEKGRLNGVGIIAADGSSMGVDYTTIIGSTSEYQLFFGLFSLMMKIHEQIWKRQAPQTKVDTTKFNVSQQVYNAANLTMGYDFLAWLIAAEMRRVKYGGEPPLKIALSCEDGFLNNPNYKYERMMHDHVMLPLINMIGAVKVDHIGDDFLWPSQSCLAEAVTLFNEGIAIPRLRPNKDAEAEMKPFKGATTITLREAHHWPQRNSNLKVWIEAAKWMRTQGEDVVFVRDTEKASEPIERMTGDKSFRIAPRASIDINCRTALYKHAKANLFMSNGPGLVDWFGSDAASIMYVPLSENDGYKCSRASWWLPSQGINAGEQFPWHKGTRKIMVWEQPTVELIKRDYRHVLA